MKKYLILSFIMMAFFLNAIKLCHINQDEWSTQLIVTLFFFWALLAITIKRITEL